MMILGLFHYQFSVHLIKKISGFYELKYKGENRSPMMCGLIIYIRLFLSELLDPPTNLTLVKNEDMSSSYVWDRPDS